MRYSYTKLNTYENCPLQYKFSYIDKWEQPSSPEARRGSEVHDCCAEYVGHLASMGLQTDLGYIRNLGVGAEAREILEAFATSHMFPPGDYQVEKKHSVMLGGNKAEYSGVMDLLDPRDTVVTITDYKTFWRILSQAEVDNSLQMKGYALIASSIYPEAREFRCIMDLVRFGATREVVYSSEDLPEIEADLLRRIEQIETDETFEARPGGTCDWCPGKKDCPSLASGIEAIASQEDALALADEYIVLKAREQDVKSLLQPYITREGNIARNGLEVGYFKSDSVTYPDMDTLHRILLEGDLIPLDYYKPDVAALKKLKGPVAYELAALAVDPGKTTFRTRKVKE